MILNYFNNPTVLVISAIVMIMALIFHNMVQTWVASRLGDNSPRFAGFGRFDPQQQLEPIGVLFLFLLGFGWPRTISTSSRNYGGRGRREALVWYAGPATYLAIGFVAILVAAVFLALGSVDLAIAFRVSAATAILHAVINLFPVFPLDGAMGALALGNRDVRRFIEQIRRFGILGFILFFLALSFLGVTGGLQRFFLAVFDRIVGSIPGL